MFCDYLAGWASGVVSLLAGHPFETIKIQQQVRGLTFTQAAKRIMGQRGWKGFYRGFAIPLVANGSLNALYFGVYGDVRDFLIQARIRHTGYWAYETSKYTKPFRPHHKTLVQDEIQNDVDQTEERSMPTFAEIYASGAVAGFVALGLSIPIELVKTKLQSQMKRRMFSGPVHCVTTIFRDRGIRGLYRGGVPTAIRNVICAAVRFSMLCGYLSVCEADLFPANSWQVFTASAIAGVTSWFVVIPFDTIKSRIQADDHRRPKYHGMIHCAVEILKRDGVIGLYRGLWSASLRVLPVVSVNFAAMEVITSQLCRRGRT